MTHKSLVIAGWITMTSALIAIPQTYLMFRLGGMDDTAAHIFQTVTQLFGIILFCTIMVCLKKLLNRSFSFHAADRFIGVMIVSTVLAGAIVLIGTYFPQHKEIMGTAAMVLLVFQGVIQIQLGYTLLKLPDTLGGMLKPFCYANMVTGLCVASLVLILAGVVISAISDVMLATIFFAAAKNAGRSGAPDMSEEA